MSDTRGAQAHLDALQANPLAFELFTALRLVEAAHPRQPRLGKAATPAQEAVRLGQDPYLEFEAATLQRAARQADGRLRLQNHAFGLFGPHGPLPLHLTEYAAERIRHAHDPGLAAFCDLFHHRLVALFYRAWADAQPVVQADRPHQDRFARYLDAIAGYFDQALEGPRPLPPHHRRHLAGRFAGRQRNAEGLAALVRLAFEVPVTIEPFVGEWLPLPEGDRCRLGGAALGDCLLGSRVWQRAGRFRIRLGPLSHDQYRSFLPGDPQGRLATLAALVHHWLGNALTWELNLVLAADQVPKPRLGGDVRLGWNLWLGDGGGRPRDELRLDGEAHASTPPSTTR